MKKTYSLTYILTVFIVTVIVSACQPDSAKNYIPRKAGDVASVTGTWKGTSVVQRDNDAELKNFPYKSQDVTAVLDFTKVTLTLTSSSGLPGNFNITYGGAPAFFKISSGQWKADNITKIGKIQLFNGSDTINLDMGSYLLLDQNKLQIKQVKSLLGKAAITYEFNFSKQ
jgi:hypothetical protein